MRERRSKTAIMSDESKDLIIRDLFNRVIELDKRFEADLKSVPSVYGLQIFPGIVLLLEHYGLSIHSFRAEEFLSKYDHFILIFPDFLSIRAIRFSGKKEFTRDSSFLISKLSKQKGEHSKIGRELLGSFITQGKFENICNPVIQILSPLLLALIRPFSKGNSIIPSPLSFIVHEIFSSGLSRRFFLSPCTMTLILKDCKYLNDFFVLGKKLKGLFVRNAVALAFDVSREELREVNLNVFLPLEKFFEQEFGFYLEHFKMGKAIAAHLLGILVMEGEPIIVPESKGFFMALQETPAQFEIQALAMYGNIRYFELKLPSRHYYYSIKCERQKVEKIRRLIQKKIWSIKRDRSVYSSFDRLGVWEYIKEPLSRCFLSKDYGIELYAPPLLPLIIDDCEYERVKRALEELREITSSSREIDSFSKLRKLYNVCDDILEKMRRWKDSFDCQQTFARKWNLSYIV